MATAGLPTIKAWCANHPPLISALAVYTAMIGRDAARIVRINDVTDHGADIPLDRNLDRWLSYYRNHRLAFADMHTIARRLPELTSIAESFARLIDDLKAIPSDTDDINHPAAAACGVRMLDLFFAMDAINPTSEPFGADILSSPSFLGLWYHLVVNVPSLLLFQTSPQRLLWRARHGDLLAAGQLRLLDRSTVFERDISRVIHAHPRAWKSIVAKAPSRRVRLRPLRWKVIAAATMRIICQHVKYQLTHPAIADLFHAFARDVDGKKRNPDLIELQDRTFERQVAVTIQERKALVAPPKVPPAA